MLQPSQFLFVLFGKGSRKIGPHHLSPIANGPYEHTGHVTQYVEHTQWQQGYGIPKGIEEMIEDIHRS